MKKRNLGRTLTAALLTALAFVLPGLASDAVFSDQQSAAQVRGSAVTLIPQSSGVHTKYMDGSGGWFNPEQPVTRAELAQMLVRIVADAPDATPSFYDVAWDAWYAPAVQKAAGLGLMTSSGGAFRPEVPATRAECAAALSMVIPYDVTVTQSFPDVGPDHWAWEAIGRTASYGLFLGDSAGLFHPDDGIKRCEAAAVFNRLLGRTPDTTYMSHHGGLRAFPDVPAGHWAYGDIMEAAVTHQCTNWIGMEVWISAVGEPTLAADPTPFVPTLSPVPTPSPAPAQPSDSALADGPQRINGRLYWVVNGEYARSQSISGLYFDENGCYTTGNAELDGKLNAIVEELTDDSMGQDEKLQALFNYCRDNFKYLKRPLISKGQTGWEPDYALYFLNNGKGNCYNFSAAYCLLCRELGLPAYTVVGSALNSPHGWVEIVMDGTVYIFDPQLAWRYLHDWGKSGYNFFKQPAASTTVEYTR